MASSLSIEHGKSPVPAAETFQFGIEEEYFLADAVTLRPPCKTRDGLFKQLPGSELRLERARKSRLLPSPTLPARRRDSSSRRFAKERPTLRCLRSEDARLRNRPDGEWR